MSKTQDKVIDEINARYCGECAWFYGEDTYGYGSCPFKFADVRKCDQRRDQHVPAIYRMPNPTELGEAIDFAGKFIKVFSNL